MIYPDLKNPSWQAILSAEFDKKYMQDLSAFLQKKQADGAVIYPAKENWFKALEDLSFDEVKVVILGQDPYHGPNQAMGYAFSVPEQCKVPPSLRNIYKELSLEAGETFTPIGDLSFWVQQGVLLLNATLTVEAGKAGAHQKKGWEKFTDQIIHALNEQRENLVFMLWGNYAQQKGAFLDRKKHLVLESVHPSPLSASRGFFGCGHFEKANNYLKAGGVETIDFAGKARNASELTLF